jgi:soluble lytic murein transglycosylase-like protein
MIAAVACLSASDEALAKRRKPAKKGRPAPTAAVKKQAKPTDAAPAIVDQPPPPPFSPTHIQGVLAGVPGLSLEPGATPTVEITPRPGWTVASYLKGPGAKDAPPPPSRFLRQREISDVRELAQRLMKAEGATPRANLALLIPVAYARLPDAFDPANPDDAAVFKAAHFDPAKLPAHERLAAGITLELVHSNIRAASVLKAVRPALATAEERCRALFHQGRAERKERLHVEAAKTLEEARATCPEGSEYWLRATFVGATSMSRTAQWKDGVLRWADMARRFRDEGLGKTLGDDALVKAAEAMAAHGELLQAEAYYLEAEDKYPDGDNTPTARFRVPFLAWRRGEWTAAASGFERAANARGIPAADRIKARYFEIAARMRGQFADEDSGLRNPATIVATVRELDDLYRSAPFNFYGLAAKALASEVAASGGKVLDATVIEPPRSTEVAPGPVVLRCGEDDPATVLGDPAVAAAIPAPLRPLLAVGRYGDAARWLDDEAPRPGYDNAPIVMPEPEARARAALHALFNQTTAAQWLLRRTVLAAYPGHRPATELDRAILCLAYPRPFADLLDEAEAASDLPRYLFTSLVREESAFDPTIVSWAGAHGLSQLMPATAKGEVRLMKPPLPEPSNADLLNATTNLAIGGHHLGRLFRMFPGDPARAIMAYNAGPGAVRDWTERFPGADIPVFIESVPYDEPSKYVSRITATWAVYRALYPTP